MKRGLIVGKFMPLHRGHQFLIETALAEVDDLTVVVYDSKIDMADKPGWGWDIVMPAEMRAGWIARLYPQIENIVVRQDVLSALNQDQKDDPMYAPTYAKDLDFLGQFDLVFSSESYGKPFADALGAKNRVVDMARHMLPISGSEIRENLYEHRAWIDPVVYRDFIRKVVFVGTESTGKSTIAERMAKELDTKWVHEYGRELWIEQDLKGSFRDMLKIAENHYRREEAAVLHSRDFLFCDTNPWTTLQWSLMYNQTADQRLVDLVENTMNEYIWILCDNDFNWVDDGARELVNGKAEAFQRQLIQDLAHRRRVPFHFIDGSINQRVDQVREILEVDTPTLV